MCRRATSPISLSPFTLKNFSSTHTAALGASSLAQENVFALRLISSVNNGLLRELADNSFASRQQVLASYITFTAIITFIIIITIITACRAMSQNVKCIAKFMLLKPSFLVTFEALIISKHH